MNKSKVLNFAAMAAIAALVVSNALTVYLLISKERSVQPTEQADVSAVACQGSSCLAPDDLEEGSAEEAIVEEEVEEEFAEAEERHVDIGYYEAEKAEIYATSGPKFVVPAGMKRLNVTWFDGGLSADREFFLPSYKPLSSLSVASYEKIFNIVGEYGDLNAWYIYKVGEIASSSERYAGQDIFSVILSCEAFDCSSSFGGGLVVADKDSSSLVILSRYSDGQQAELKKIIGSSIFKEDKAAYIAELENPEKIDLPGAKEKLVKTSDIFLPSFNKDGLLYHGEDYVTEAANGKRVYLYQDGCFRVYNDNGSYSTYEFDYPFSVSAYGEVLDLTFNDGTENKSDYIGLNVGGCGPRGCGRILGLNDEAVKEAGIFGNGDKAYELNFNSLPEGKDNILANTYDNAYFFDKEKPSMEDFLASHPLVLWKMPIADYYLGFLKADFMPATECGKPVIYLYPEKESDVKVQVEPNGGFSITDPIYGADGWLVRADTQSNLYNYADGKNYPYLFWEGKAVYYERPTKGFVVARENIDGFLDEKLAKLGMVGKEITDFKEFWAPKMTEKPYYFVTFLPKAEFDALAPMKVEPRPRTVIRVFMDYQGLNDPITVEEPVIETPVRKGFTVVEWGGALGRN